MPEALALPTSITEAAASSALQAAGVATKELVAEAKKDPAAAWRWSGICVCVGILCFTGYVTLKDSRDARAMTQDQYEESNAKRDTRQAEENKARDDRVTAIREQFLKITERLTSAVETVAAIRVDMDKSESRLRVDIQGTNARIDRVLEAVSRPSTGPR